MSRFRALLGVWRFVKGKPNFYPMSDGARSSTGACCLLGRSIQLKRESCLYSEYLRAWGFFFFKKIKIKGGPKYASYFYAAVVKNTRPILTLNMRHFSRKMRDVFSHVPIATRNPRNSTIEIYFAFGTRYLRSLMTRATLPKGYAPDPNEKHNAKLAV